MLIHWSFNPVLATIGPFSIHWYGVLFVSAFLMARTFMARIFRSEDVPPEHAERLLYYALGGAVVGARLAHCLFYDPAYYLSEPMAIFRVWEGGLASHGGMVGILMGLWLGARRLEPRLSFLWLIDRVSIPAALGAVFVRVANFINSEIVGNPTYASWGVVFESVDGVARHPVQLYEATAYLMTFLALYLCYRKLGRNPPQGLLFGLFLTLVFSSRVLIEFCKAPQAAYDATEALSTGQYLSIPMAMIGGALVWWSIGHANRVASSAAEGS